MLGLFFPYGDMAFLKSENVLFDGVGGSGWMGRKIKSVLQISLYFVGI